jgi:hypothetical protein
VTKVSSALHGNLQAFRTLWKNTWSM